MKNSSTAKSMSLPVPCRANVHSEILMETPGTNTNQKNGYCDQFCLKKDIFRSIAVSLGVHCTLSFVLKNFSRFSVGIPLTEVKDHWNISVGLPITAARELGVHSRCPHLFQPQWLGDVNSCFCTLSFLIRHHWVFW